MEKRIKEERDTEGGLLSLCSGISQTVPFAMKTDVAVQTQSVLLSHSWLPD